MLNKTATFLAFVGLAGLLVIGVVIILLLRPDSVGALVTLVSVILSLAAGFALQLYAANKTGEKLERQAEVIEKVQKQTNGTLSAKDAEITRLRAIAAKAGINPDDAEHQDVSPPRHAG